MQYHYRDFMKCYCCAWSEQDECPHQDKCIEEAQNTAELRNSELEDTDE